jgi:hypothetical protein
MVRECCAENLAALIDGLKRAFNVIAIDVIVLRTSFAVVRWFGLP